MAVLDRLSPSEPVPVQVVDPQGRTDPDRDLGALGIDGPLLRDLHRRMLLARRLDSELINLQRQGQLALYPSSAGQEAAQIGTAAALGPDDWLVPSYREHGCMYARGIDPVDLACFWRGTWTGLRGSIEKRVTPHCVPVGTNALHAVGIAMGSRLDGRDIVVAAYLGDGATSEGDAHEAFNFAAVFRAPVVFVVQNNGWAISVPVERQTRAAAIADKALGYGMPGARVDGNDVVACLVVMREAVARARAGDGPTLIEAVTYRIEPHTTADDDTRYRTRDEVERWRGADPIRRIELLLRSSGDWDDAYASESERLAAEATAELRRGICATAPGALTEVFDHVFVDPPASMLEQRDELAAELARRPGPEG
jgi:2-oxoisovalerate dehydrogenase E1 component alpha subunit